MTECVECGHDPEDYGTTVNGEFHCYACGLPKQRQRRDDASDE